MAFLRLRGLGMLQEELCMWGNGMERCAGEPVPAHSGSVVALPWQCPPQESCLFFWELHRCRAVAHGRLSTVAKGKGWSVSLQRAYQLTLPRTALDSKLVWGISLFNSCSALVLSYLSSTALFQGGMCTDRHQTCTARAGEGVGSGDTMIQGSEHIWITRASVLQSRFATKLSSKPILDFVRNTSKMPNA